MTQPPTHATRAASTPGSLGQQAALVLLAPIATVTAEHAEQARAAKRESARRDEERAVAERVRAARVGRTRVLNAIALLLAALAFLAGPFLVMGPLGAAHYLNTHHSLSNVLLGLIIGPGCFVWLLAGIAAVVIAVGNLFASLVES